MGYNIVFDNILNITTDAIVNYVNNEKESNPGTILITDGYNQKANKIYNLTLPNKSDDDISNSTLTNSYLNVLLKAIDNNIKTIAFSVKGNNINNYSYSQVFDALTSACAEIDKLEEKRNEDLIDITICLGRKIKHKKNYKTSASYDFNYNIKKFENNSCNSFNFVTINKNIKSEDDFDKCLNFMKNYKESEATKIEIISECPYDFIDQYISIHNIDETVLSKGGLDRKRKYRLRQSKTLKKMDVYRLIFLLKMNNSDVIQFMMCCGLSFNPLDKTDLFFIDYLNGKFKYDGINSLVDLTNLDENVEEALFYY